VLVLVLHGVQLKRLGLWTFSTAV